MFNKSVSEDFEQARKDFNYALEELVTPSQHIIGALSMLCDENSRYATVYVECIVKRIRKVDRDLKLPSIYLIDSVIKNAPHYRKLFEPEIVSVMGEAYRCVDERTKLLILKVRQTWNGIFSADILNRLDAVLRPHTAKNGLPSSKSSIYINPDFGKSSTRNFDRLSRPLGPPSTRQAHKISPSRLSKKERDTRHFFGIPLEAAGAGRSAPCRQR
ncbi:pre-mRNA cleavage complex 2 protein Pcf11-like [Zophobas morio]|uniref:pre-mRNA cleavage complex 2 protein Pcf11-like n=1 Tax=Zophobas morio TaxID=2755281 RepID=UPI00308280FD